MSLQKKLFIGFNKIVFFLPFFVKKQLLNAASFFPFEIRLPSPIFIELTNHCTASCPLCPVGNKSMTRDRGYMRYDHFKIIIDEVCTFCKYIIFNFAGEPLLNPDFGDMCAYAASKGIRMRVHTNGAIAKIEELLNSGIAEIIFALDGVTKESYEKFRVGLEYEKTMKNLIDLCKRRERPSLKNPKIILQFVVMKHNEHEIKNVLSLARELKIDKVELKPVAFMLSPHEEEKNRGFLPTNPTYNKYEIKNSKLDLDRPPLCAHLFHTAILYNGDVTICCSDFNGEHVVGNIIRDGGLINIWRSEKYKRLRKQMVSGKLGLCHKCGEGL